VAKINKFGIEMSTDVAPGGAKILFWGDTSTRKTEAVLRNFPHVLLIDAEGNSDPCLRMKEIPPFMRIKTKDPRKVMELLRSCEKGEIKFPDGSSVETFCIDSWSVLWGVQSEFAAALAEARSARKNYNVAEANATPSDWGKAKRPMKSLLNAANGSKIRYMVFIARQKEEVIELPNGDTKKTGEVMADVMKNTMYDMNLALHFKYVSGSWCFSTTKVQGDLSTIFPLGKQQPALPYDKLFKFFSENELGQGATQDDADIAREQVEEDMAVEFQPSQAGLISYAKSKGLAATDVGAALKASGIHAFDVKIWDDMVMAVDKEISRRGQ
jgi:hypothetical protein